jgi:hypothetical protein
LVAALVRSLSSPLPDEVTAAVRSVGGLLQRAILADSALSCRVADGYDATILEDARLSPASQAEFLLGIVLDPEVESEFVFAAFIPLSLLVGLHWDTVGDLLPRMLEAIFRASAVLFDDGCAKDQENVRFVVEQMQEMLDRAAAEIDTAGLADETPADGFVSLLIYEQIIRRYPDAVVDCLPHVVEFIVEHTKDTTGHAICEQAMSCMELLVWRGSERFAWMKTMGERRHLANRSLLFPGVDFAPVQSALCLQIDTCNAKGFAGIVNRIELGSEFQTELQSLGARLTVRQCFIIDCPCGMGINASLIKWTRISDPKVPWTIPGG